MFILLGIGWVKDFPRWSLPAVGFCTLFSAFFTAVTVPGFKDENLGYWAWVPLLITLVICLIIKPSISPAKQLAKQIKNEPILIGFILYGFAPFFIFLFCDEIHSVWMLPIVLVSTFILSLGLYLFLKSERRRMRFLSIVYSGLLAFIITFTASYFYWEFLFKY
jgi:hypothetical protein